MQAYATVFGIIALISCCFVDNGIQPAISKVGRITLLISGVAFVITEAIALIR